MTSNSQQFYHANKILKYIFGVEYESPGPLFSELLGNNHNRF